MTASELEKDLQNQIDSLQSDYDQMIGITEEEYEDRMNDLVYQLNEVEDHVEEFISEEKEFIKLYNKINETNETCIKITE
jgi:hypothetical protein